MNKYCCILLVILATILQISQSIACGGNCPTSDCTICPCGKAKKNISIQSYCKQFSGWDQQCCYCMVARTSAGNRNYMKPLQNHYALGVLPLFYDVLKKDNVCQLTTEADLCNELKNSECAGKTYVKDGWDGPDGIWKNAAQACGCQKKSIKIE